jgi:hypothetical protein
MRVRSNNYLRLIGVWPPAGGGPVIPLQAAGPARHAEPFGPPYCAWQVNSTISMEEVTVPLAFTV